MPEPVTMPEPRPLTPGDRQRVRFPAGTPLELAGAVWYLAPGGLHPEIDDLRDDLHDRACLSGGFRLNAAMPGAGDDWYAVADVAVFLLRLQYDLTAFEAAGLVARGCEPADLYGATHAALFGDARPRRTYTEWARGSLLAAGLVPHLIPPADVPLVLELLVRSNRAVPAHEFISAQRAAPALDVWRAMARVQQPRAAD